MTSQLIPLPENSAIVLAGQAANKAAAEATFTDYRRRIAENTRRRQDSDLLLFADYLEAAGVIVRDLNANPAAWRGVTWGLVSGFIEWMLKEGYAIDSINVRLSTVKQYAQLALKAGALDVENYAMIRVIKGYSHKEKPNIDGDRKAQGLETRRTIKARTTRNDGGSRKNHKKSEALFLDRAQRDAITASDGTPQGTRDALIIRLMLDHGLRVGEVAGLEVSNFNLSAKTFTFYRPKTKQTNTHRMTEETAAAVRAYWKHAPKSGSLWRSSAPKNAGKASRGKLTERQGMTTAALYQRVEMIGRRAGIEGLSPHDLRHTWAERAKGNATRKLQEAGGWNSPAMAIRYQARGTIANEGLILED